MADTREVWITGIGLLSSLGEGNAAHWDALQQGRTNVDAASYAPCLIHPLAAVNFDTQIPKKTDQRQMETWQRIGTHAAGLALESAGLKDNAETLARMDMIVAAGGGERNNTVDYAVLNAIFKDGATETDIVDRLQGSLRPTLFLAQLSNLLAGNISIVHGVSGSSRTFMGEEESGINAVRIAHDRIHAGQSEIALVGASYNAERAELLQHYECGHLNLKDQFVPIWARGSKGGFALGSAGAFIVLEARSHAEARGAKPLARLRAIAATHTRRAQHSVVDALDEMWKQVAPAGDAAILTTASGAEPATAQERAFLASHPGQPVRGLSTAFGNTVETQFPLAVALAALCLSHGTLYPPNDPTGFEQPSTAPLRQIAALTVGHWRGEGLALVERVD